MPILRFSSGSSRKNTKAPNRVLFAIHRYSLAGCPSIQDAANFLAENGFLVDILLDRHRDGVVEFRNGRVQVETVFANHSAVKAGPAELEPGPSAAAQTTFHDKSRLFVPSNVRKQLRPLWRPVWRAWCGLRATWIALRAWTTSQLPFIFRAMRLAYSRRYCSIVGIEPEGLLGAVAAGTVFGIPVLYWSLERRLSHKSLVHAMGRIDAVIERICARFPVSTLIQDHARARLLQKQTGIPFHRTLLVPVSVRGRRPTKTDYLRERFGIPSEKRILLFAGGIAWWSRCVELACAAHSWPEDWVLVLHRSPAPIDPSYLENLLQYSKAGRVILSLESVPLEHLDRLVASADVGIALYRDIDPNLRYIAAASGKLAQYLKCALPVITSDFGGLRDVVDGFQCGRCVRAESEIAEAASEIFERYGKMSINAEKCFTERYFFDAHFEKVLRRIEKVGRVKRQPVNNPIEDVQPLAPNSTSDTGHSSSNG